MSVQQLFFQKCYAFPFTIPFQTAVVGSSLLYVSASAFSSTPNSRIGVNVALDGTLLGTLNLFANEANSHKTLVSMLFSLSIGDKATHEITCSPATPNTRCDQNDTINGVQLKANGMAWNTTGPLPQKIQYKSPVSGPATVFFSGSAWVHKVQPIGIEMTVKSKPVALSSCFASVISSHIACPPIFTTIMAPYGDVEIGFAPTSPETITDVNDYYQMAVIF